MSCGNEPGAIDEQDGEALMPLCHRCKSAPSAMIVRSITYCRDCFVASLPRRVAKHLHPALYPAPPRSLYHHPPPQAGGVVLALSGGAGSMALLDILSTRTYIAPAGAANEAVVGDGGAGDVEVEVEVEGRAGGAGSGASGASGDSGRAAAAHDGVARGGADAARPAGKTRPSRAGGSSYAKTAVWRAGWAVHVDFSGVAGGADQTARLRRAAEARGWHFIGLRAEDVFAPSAPSTSSTSPISSTSPTSSASSTSPASSASHTLAVDLADARLPLTAAPASPPLDALRALLAALPAPSRPALLAATLDALLADTCARLPAASHLVLGETATREAARVIAGTAAGRGWALPLELAAARAVRLAGGAPAREVARLRPMKDVAVKEAAYYCHLRGIETANARAWDAAGQAGSTGRGAARGKARSIEALTEAFIAGLDATHPSTVSTINRTGDKLVFTGDARAAPCPLCQLPVDDSALAWKARSALTSLAPDAPAPDPDVTDTDTAAAAAPLAGPSAPSAPAASPSLAPLLCYACLATLAPARSARDGPSAPAPLPPFVGAGVARRVGRAEMRGAIGEFLLGDGQSDDEDGEGDGAEGDA